MTKRTHKMTITYLGKTINGGFKIKTFEKQVDDLNKLNDLATIFDNDAILEIKVRRETVFDV